MVGVGAIVLLTNIQYTLDVIDLTFFTLCRASLEKEREGERECASVLLQGTLGPDTQNPTQSGGHIQTQTQSSCGSLEPTITSVSTQSTEKNYPYWCHGV